VARIISLANQKGGVGKTTSTISLGAALGELGQRVLLVDFDPQGALSVGVGVNSMELEQTVYNLLLDRSTRFEDVVVKTNVMGVELLPGNIDLSAAEVVLVSEVAREQALKRVLSAIREAYDYVLIDCPPSLGLLTVNALTASDEVIIPLECEFFALRGMALLVDTIEKVRDRLNPELEIKGVVPTMYDGRTIHAREVLSRVREAFGTRLFSTTIPRTVRFAEAPVAGEPILTYAGDSKGAQAYRRLAKEVLGIVDDQASDPAGSGRAVPGDLDPAASTTTGGDALLGAAGAADSSPVLTSANEAGDDSAIYRQSVEDTSP
jgi:chromosome partitioning protein